MVDESGFEFKGTHPEDEKFALIGGIVLLIENHYGIDRYDPDDDASAPPWFVTFKDNSTEVIS